MYIRVERENNMAYSVIIFPSNDASISDPFMYISIPIDVFKKMMYKTEINGVLLSQLSLIDQDEYSGDELLKIKEEVNELIKNQLVHQQDMQELLKLLQFAFDNKRRVLFTPFNWSHTPLAKFEL